ncbi:hypothetical protein [Agromyces sp. CCNWLW203]|uniref:hypothetical protein n=1 Tax=Agromyces sp. CCNWLW203 TaxID=3112842 RepID=UPI002F962F52
MPNGDDAAGAGMEVLNPLTDLVRDGADFINYVLDEIARRTAAVMPMERGGHGATTPAGARINLGISSPNIGRPGGDTVEQAIVWLGANKAASGHTHSFADITSGVVNGSIGVTGDIENNGRVRSSGSRGFTVAVNWGAAALDGSGYLGIQPSAERFKQDINPRVYTLADAVTIGRLVVEYRLVAAVEALDASAPIEVGIIAERLLEAGFPEFVVFNPGGEVLSIHYAEMVTVSLSAFVEVAEFFVDIETRLIALEAAR